MSHTVKVNSFLSPGLMRQQHTVALAHRSSHAQKAEGPSLRRALCRPRLQMGNQRTFRQVSAAWPHAPPLSDDVPRREYQDPCTGHNKYATYCHTLMCALADPKRKIPAPE